VDAPRAARGAPRTDLEEILQGIRRELQRRDDAPTGGWIEATARELTTGARPGWYYPPSAGGALAFYARRGAEAYGHVHAGESDGGSDRAFRLATAVLDGVPADVASANLGFTGLDSAGERALARRLAERPGSTVIERSLMERMLGPADGGPAPDAPPGVRGLPVREVTVDSLADLDHRAFGGTVDAYLVGAGLEGTRIAIESMLDGRLGRFVDEASLALIETDPVRLVGAVLTTEQTIRRAILVDLMVDPDRRRHGLGRYLVTWTFRALRALGYESVRLWVTEANAPARALYDGFGFRAVDAAAIYRWDRPGSSAQPHVAP